MRWRDSSVHVLAAVFLTTLLLESGFGGGGNGEVLPPLRGPAGTDFSKTLAPSEAPSGFVSSAGLRQSKVTLRSR